MRKRFFVFLSAWLLSVTGYGWGFYAHQRINRLAVFCLPPEMIAFYKPHITFITENAVNPDQRRYAVEGEAPRHYIDLDVYGDSALLVLPRYWRDAVARYTEDTLMMYGVVPWHIYFIKQQLTDAFKKRDAKRILRLSADLGHYIADANVPLHTTQNYNGQLTGQTGIHGFWESRLPELFSDTYDFFVGPAQYVDNPQLRAWQAVAQAHQALDSVLDFERELTKRFAEDKKYSFETRGATTVRVYSQAFASAYHAMLSGQVERRMRASVKMVADFWYTCWVDAGQPDLRSLTDNPFSDDDVKAMEEEKREWEKRHLRVRAHETVMRQPDNCYNCGHTFVAGSLPWGMKRLANARVRIKE